MLTRHQGGERSFRCCRLREALLHGASLLEVGLQASDFPEAGACLMRDQTQPTRFCEPCCEAMVLGIYRFLKAVRFREGPVAGDYTKVGAQTTLPPQEREVRWTWIGSDSAPPGFEDYLERASRRGELRLRLPLGRLPAGSALRLAVGDLTAQVRRGRDGLRWERRFALPGRASLEASRGLTRALEGAAERER